jgi:GGDEF domain-containing protein
LSNRVEIGSRLTRCILAADQTRDRPTACIVSRSHLMKRVDDALYAAKRVRRNRVCAPR